MKEVASEAGMAAMAATVAMEAMEVDGAAATADAMVVVKVVDGADETTFVDDEPNLEND